MKIQKGKYYKGVNTGIIVKALGKETVHGQFRGIVIESSPNDLKVDEKYSFFNAEFFNFIDYDNKIIFFPLY